jgi:hypothetical protein
MTFRAFALALLAAFGCAQSPGLPLVCTATFTTTGEGCAKGPGKTCAPPQVEQRYCRVRGR